MRKHQHDHTCALAHACTIVTLSIIWFKLYNSHCGQLYWNVDGDGRLVFNKEGRRHMGTVLHCTSLKTYVTTATVEDGMIRVRRTCERISVNTPTTTQRVRRRARTSTSTSHSALEWSSMLIRLSHTYMLIWVLMNTSSHSIHSWVCVSTHSYTGAHQPWLAEFVVRKCSRSRSWLMTVYYVRLAVPTRFCHVSHTFAERILMSIITFEHRFRGNWPPAICWRSRGDPILCGYFPCRREKYTRTHMRTLYTHILNKIAMLILDP